MKVYMYMLCIRSSFKLPTTTKMSCFTCYYICYCYNCYYVLYLFNTLVLIYTEANSQRNTDLGVHFYVFLYLSKYFFFDNTFRQ